MCCILGWVISGESCSLRGKRGAVKLILLARRCKRIVRKNNFSGRLKHSNMTLYIITLSLINTEKLVEAGSVSQRGEPAGEGHRCLCFLGVCGRWATSNGMTEAQSWKTLQLSKYMHGLSLLLLTTAAPDKQKALIFSVLTAWGLHLHLQVHKVSPFSDA